MWDDIEFARLKTLHNSDISWCNVHSRKNLASWQGKPISPQINFTFFCVFHCPMQQDAPTKNGLKAVFKQWVNEKWKVETRSWHCSRRSHIYFNRDMSLSTDNVKGVLQVCVYLVTFSVGQMLDGWQGWWTSGSYKAGVNLFDWRDGSVIDNTPANWGFQRTPFLDTCVWVLQIPIYNYTLGNYDCNTSSGFICEINSN